jgi:aspartate racemase
MGPLATVAFLQALTLATTASRDQDHLHVLVDSDPAIPDRTAFLLGSGEDPRPAIIRAARRLEEAGATYLVMPCNTANAFAPDVAAAVSVPLLPWIDFAAAAALRLGGRVGLIATDGMLASGLYQQAIVERGGLTIEPADQRQQEVMAVIYGTRGVKAAGPTADQRRVMVTVADELVRRGAEAILLACTEVPLAVAADDPAWPVPAIDPAVAVANEAVRYAGLEVRQPGAVG